MTASILSLRQDYKERACRWRAFNRLRSTKYGRIKRYDAGPPRSKLGEAGLE
jgi:hypothetical protein